MLVKMGGKAFTTFKNDNKQEISLICLYTSVSTYAKYTFGTPFTIHLDPEHCEHVFQKQAWVFRLLTFTIHASTILSQLAQLAPFFMTTLIEKSFNHFFVCTIWLLWISFMTKVLRLFWTNNKNQIKLIRQISKICRSLHNLEVPLPSLIKVKILSALLITTFLSRTIMDLLPLFQKGIYGTYIYEINRLENNYGLYNSNATDSLPLTTLVKQTPYIHLLAALYIMLGEVISEQVSNYAELICLVNAILFFWIVRMFVGYLKRNGVEPEKWNLVLNTFADIAILSNNIKAAWGPAFTGACFICLPYYSYTLKNVFRGAKLLNSLLTGLSIASFLVFLLLAAEANAMLRDFTTSIRDAKIRDVSWNLKFRLKFHERLILILNQMENHVGLQGNGFTITYKFVGIICEIVVSYAIAAYQIERSSRS